MLQSTDSLGPLQHLCPGPAAVLAPLCSPKLLCQPRACVRRALFPTGRVPSTAGKWDRGHGMSGSSGAVPSLLARRSFSHRLVFLDSSASAGLLLSSLPLLCSELSTKFEGPLVHRWDGGDGSIG